MASRHRFCFFLVNLFDFLTGVPTFGGRALQLQVKLFVMGQLLEDDEQPLMHLRGIYEPRHFNRRMLPQKIELETEPKIAML